MNDRIYKNLHLNRIQFLKIHDFFLNAQNLIFFQRIQRGHEIEIEDFFLLNLKFQFYIFNATFNKLFLFYINKYSIFFLDKIKILDKNIISFQQI